MRNFILIIAVFAISATIISANYKDQKMLRHVVLFKFKESATPEQIKKVEDAFKALPSKIKEVKAFEWGTNNSPEGLNEGLTHCFFVTFASEKDREAYLPHPEHKAFVEVLKPYLEKAVVVDYWAK
ncbi:stress responsive protein [Terrimonas sp.]|uniref:Dabb family protein n=1 Tax=Terrimonas sp. TaxID=1914338 RepID=UPI000D51C922|nr:Dabb family protein [Terrimonas sp.]PVD54066.1 stress responsive protein [Terrimonas sp.]